MVTCVLDKNKEEMINHEYKRQRSLRFFHWQYPQENIKEKISRLPNEFALFYTVLPESLLLNYSTDNQFALGIKVCASVLMNC